MNLEELTKRELIELYKASTKQIRDLVKEIEKLKRQVEKLSGSKELPHFIKPNVDNAEPKKLGAKEGHEGVTRPTPEKVDEKKEVGMKRCPRGHRIAKIKEKKKRIVEDIEIVRRTRVTEYELQGYWCKKCKKKVFPKIFEAMPGFRLGMNFCNYVCERKFGYRMTYNLIQKDLLENFGLKVSQGTLVNAVHAVSNLLGKKYELYKTLLREGKFVHIDETGWRVRGTNLWLWKFRSENTVVTVINWRRSHVVPEDVIGEDYEGIVVRDGYQAYNMLKCKKQQCWAHILRHSKKACEKYPNSEEAKIFHTNIKSLHQNAKKVKKLKRNRTLFENRLKRLTSKRFYNPELKKLKKFLTRHFDELFLFLEENIESTNNAAERAIRNDVVIRKISGGNRSPAGRHDYEVISSVIQTCQMRNEDFSKTVMDELKSTAYG